MCYLCIHQYELICRFFGLHYFPDTCTWFLFYTISKVAYIHSLKRISTNFAQTIFHMNNRG